MGYGAANVFQHTQYTCEFFLLVGVALAGFVGNGMWQSVNRARTFSEVAQLVSLDKLLFNALLNFRSERGNSASA